jgi:hypothetical protein
MGQSLTLSGAINDNLDGSPLPDAAVSVAPTKDTTNVSGVLTDDNGKFQITGLSKGTYVIKVTYVGYENLVRYVRLDSVSKNIGILKLREESEMLKSVTVTAKADHVQQKNDTTEYNAETFKTNPDATAEDLLNKMPGISSANGTVTAHGETVQKVLVDGKEFFGDDATTAIKNLPAEIVDKVQVFDRLSDQSAFTGFDDGNSQKTINITTKKGRNNGVFGKLYAGYGYLTDSRYSAGGNVNWFDGDRRLSLIGMSNDINQQNFSSQDLLGVSGTGGRRGGGGASASNFLVGNQGGISTTHSVGLNYIDTWGKKKKVKVAASYFYNYTDNTTLTSLARQYYNNGTRYNENDTSRSINQNHRVNLRIEYAADSFNSFIFTPKISYQQNTQHYGLAGQTLSGDAVQSQTVTDQYTYNAGYSFSGDVLYQHKFPKRFRTFSIDLGTSINNKWGNGSQISNSYYFDTTSVDTVMLDQQSYMSSKSYAMTASVSYTEPMSKNSMLQLNYAPSYTISKSDQEVDSLERQLITRPYLLDTSLSSQYNSNYMTQKAGISFRYKNDKVNAAVGVNGQYALLTGANIFPFAYNTTRTFYSVLPNAMLNIKFKNTSSLRIMYRTSTSPPSISQLQNVINNSNPLLLSTGNPLLNQSYTNSLTLRYGFAKGPKGQSFFAFANVSNTMNNVANATIIADNDTSVTNDGKNYVTLRKGSQLSRSVNIDGYWSANSFLTYGVAINPMKCNFNLNGGISYTRTPGLINNVLNLSNAIAPTFGATLSSNISEKIDFTISYSGTYNIVSNTLQTTTNNNYYTHTANAKFNWLFWKGFVFNTTLQNSLYQGVASGFNQDIFLWNAALGYKFLKDKSLEVRAGVNDILNQNTGVSRTISQTYIEDDRTQVIKRYMLVTVTWTLRYFKKGSKAPDGFDSGEGNHRGGRNFNGGPRGPGGPGGPGGPPPGGGGPGD